MQPGGRADHIAYGVSRVPASLWATVGEPAVSRGMELGGIVGAQLGAAQHEGHRDGSGDVVGPRAE